MWPRATVLVGWALVACGGTVGAGPIAAHERVLARASLPEVLEYVGDGDLIALDESMEFGRELGFQLRKRGVAVQQGDLQAERRLQYTLYELGALYFVALRLQGEEGERLMTRAYRMAGSQVRAAAGWSEVEVGDDGRR